MRFAQFRNDVVANAHRLRTVGCRRGLLIPQDGYWVAVGVLALLHAGATVVLPQHMQVGGFGVGNWDYVVTDRSASRADQSQSSALFLLAPGGSRAGEQPPLCAEACIFELYTAGSTGKPKAVVKTLGQMERESAIVETLLGGELPTSAPVLGTVPLHHLYGLTFRLFWPLTTGRPFFGRTYDYWESLTGGVLAGAVLITSPAHLTRISVPVLATDERPVLVLSAGAELPEAAAEEACSVLGPSVMEIYGSTETGVIAWRRRSELTPPWTPFPGIDVRRTPAGQIGISSPLIGGSDIGEGGWYEGADLVDLEADRRFHLKGRADRIVKVEGKRVSLPDLERRLTAHSLVTEAAVVWLDEGRPVLGGVVVLNAAGQRELAKLGAFRFGRLLRRDLSLVQDPSGLPRRWRFVTNLPTGALGKRRQVDLRALFEDAASRPME